MVHPKSFLTFQLTLYVQHYMNYAIHKLKEHKLELKHPYVPKFIKFICNFLNSCPYRESGADGGGGGGAGLKCIFEGMFPLEKLLGKYTKEQSKSIKSSILITLS